MWRKPMMVGVPESFEGMVGEMVLVVEEDQLDTQGIGSYSTLV